jgi:CheY-like chemotaxis protein
MDRLFTPFERLDAANSDVEGTGIGLTLSKHLAEAMGGTLVASSVVGRGSTFSVDLPYVEGPVERLERHHPMALVPDVAPPSEEDCGRRHTILYIEDNVSNLKLMERVLARRGDVELVTAVQGRLGVELARQHRPAMILLDLHLPDVTGEEILRRLREDAVTSSVPVVMVTADATGGQVQRLLSAGATAYLTKPLDVGQLLIVVDTILTRR